MNDELVVREILDRDTERAHRVDRRLRVAGAAEATHVRVALGDRAEQHGTMRDRLVAGHGDVADDG